jgi:hypothetical protein
MFRPILVKVFHVELQQNLGICSCFPNVQCCNEDNISEEGCFRPHVR